MIFGFHSIYDNVNNGIMVYHWWEIGNETDTEDRIIITHLVESNFNTIPLKTHIERLYHVRANYFGIALGENRTSPQCVACRGDYSYFWTVRACQIDARAKLHSNKTLNKIIWRRRDVSFSHCMYSS